jgi:uncharacterized protein (TIGR03086 family)
MRQLQDDFRRAVEQFGDKVHAVPDDAWTNETPCSEWNVRALVNHLVNEASWVPPLMQGRTVAEVGSRFDGDLLGDEPAAAWDRAAVAAADAMSAPDAMTSTVHVSFGEITGEEYCEQLFTDFVIHGWDLARGIGADDTLDAEFAARLYEEMAPREADLRGYGMYGDHVDAAPDADTQTKLLAIFGRQQ